MVTKTANGIARIFTPVSHRKLYTQPWTIFFKLIKNSITDPKDRGTLWFYGSHPKWIIEATEEAELKENYPLVIMPNIEVTNQNNLTMDYSAKEYVPQITTEIFSDRNDYLDIITENITQIILDNESFLTSIGIYNIKISSDNVDPNTTRDGLKIYHRILSFTFEVVTECL